MRATQGMSKTVGIRALFVVSVVALLAIFAGCGSKTTSTGGNQTAMPTFSPGGGAYNTSQAVTIADATQGAVLYCTTDGTTPTTSSPKCAEPTTVFKTEFLQAVAVAPTQNPSAVGSAAYTIDLSAAATPTFSPAGGSYTSTQQVAITDKTAGVNIYYTTDGTVPTASSTLYTSPVAVSTTETLSAIAVASGFSNSGIASAAYTISQAVPSPVFSLPTGNYPAAQTVTITDTDANAAIFYTVDGSTPTSASMPYTAPITVSQTEAIGAIAIDAGSASAVTTVAYSIGVALTVPAPVFAPATGSTLGAGQAVTILDGDTNATLYYTTDGSTPSATSTPYPAGGVLLTTPGTFTITAIAIDMGNSSPVGTATYTVTPSAVPAPTFSPASGTTISAGMTVTITDTDSNATLYYTTNGSTPTASSTPYPAAGIVPLYRWSHYYLCCRDRHGQQLRGHGYLHGCARQCPHSHLLSCQWVRRAGTGGHDYRRGSECGDLLQHGRQHAFGFLHALHLSWRDLVDGRQCFHQSHRDRYGGEQYGRRRRVHRHCD